MDFTIDVIIFIGCNKRFVHLSQAEKLNETISLAQYWTDFVSRLPGSSLRFFTSPEAVPVVADVSTRLGKEINCIILPEANEFAASLKKFMQTSLENKKNSLILLSNNAYIPKNVEIMTVVHKFEAGGKRFLFFGGEKSGYENFPRLVFSLDNKPVASVPKAVAGLSRVLSAFFTQTEKDKEIPTEKARRLAIELIGCKAAARASLHGLYEFLESADKLTRADIDRFFIVTDRIVQLDNGTKMTGAEIEKSAFVDLGLYLMTASVMPELLAAAGKTSKAETYSPFDLIAAATALNAVEVEFELVRSTTENLPRVKNTRPERNQSEHKKERAIAYALSQSGEKRLRTWLLEAYGLDKSLIKEKFEYLSFIFELFFYHYGEGDMSVGRAATPVELLGRHLDNFGGMINAAAISRECQVLTRKTGRREIRIRCTAPAQFPDTTIEIADLIAQTKQGTWHEIAKDEATFEFVGAQQHPWTAMILAVILRMFALERRPLAGLDILIANSMTANTGFDIKTSLAFALAQSLVHLHGHSFSEQQIYTFIGEVFAFLRLEIPRREITTLACARAGKILPIQFSPIAIAKYVQFPDACRLLFCHSGVTNIDAAIPQNTMLRLKESIPRCFKLVEQERSIPGMQIKYIRDLLPKKLAVSIDEFYRLMRQVPEHVTDTLFQNKIVSTPANREQTKTVAQLLPVRNALIYLIGEYCRCRELIVRLNMGDVNGAGRLLRISHDGERVAVRKNGRLEKYRLHYTDELLADLQKIAGQNPESVALYEQSGAVQTSSPEIDELVDVLHSVHGVLGAHISGAGAGGGALALVEKGVVEACIEHLDREYYQPRGFEKLVLSSRPVSGSSGIQFSLAELTTALPQKKIT